MNPKPIAVAVFVAILGLTHSAAAHGPGSLDVQLITPCRWLDTRIEGCVTGGGCHSGPMVGRETREYLIQASAVCPMTGPYRPIPMGARGLLVTVTAVDATAPGNLLLFNPQPWSIPLASSINFAPGANVANTTVVQLGEEVGRFPGEQVRPDLAIAAHTYGSVHVVVDILGYLMPVSIAPASPSPE